MFGRFANARFELVHDLLVDPEVLLAKLTILRSEGRSLKQLFQLCNERFEYRDASVEFAVHLATPRVYAAHHVPHVDPAKTALEHLFPKLLAGFLWLPGSTCKTEKALGDASLRFQHVPFIRARQSNEFRLDLAIFANCFFQAKVFFAQTNSMNTLGKLDLVWL